MVGSFFVLKNFFLSLEQTLCQLWGSVLRQQVFWAFWNIGLLRLRQPIPTWPQTLVFGSREEQTNQAGKQGRSLIQCVLQAFHHACSKPAGRSHHNLRDIPSTSQRFPLQVLLRAGVPSMLVVWLDGGDVQRISWPPQVSQNGLIT